MNENKMNNTFTAIDFETAHPQRWSICQVGLVRVENGTVIEKLSILVQPPDNYFWDMFINIHGITPEQTKNAPTFYKVWEKIKQFIENQNVVAHNGFAFDFYCLRATLGYYQLAMPEFTGHCTYRIFGDNLVSLCEKYNIPLNHHEAMSDALACAELFKMHLLSLQYK